MPIHLSIEQISLKQIQTKISLKTNKNLSKWMASIAKWCLDSEGTEVNPTASNDRDETR